MTIARTATGLLLADDFERAPGAPGASWTANGGAWAIVAGALKGSGPDNATLRVAGVARTEIVSQVTITKGPVETPSWNPRYNVGTDEGYILSVRAPGARLYRKLGGVYTDLGSYGGPFGAGQPHTVKVHAEPTRTRVWDGTGALKLTVNDSALAALAGSAAARIDTGIPGGSPATWDDVALYASNVVTVTGLPAGYRARVGTVMAVSVAGVATIDLGGQRCPLGAVDVLDAANTLVESEPVDVWGGDTFLFTPAVPPPDPEPPAWVETDLDPDILLPPTLVEVAVGLGPEAGKARCDGSAFPTYFNASGVFGGVTLTWEQYSVNGFTVFLSPTFSETFQFVPGTGNASTQARSITSDTALRGFAIDMVQGDYGGTVIRAYDADDVLLAAVVVPLPPTPLGTSPVTLDLGPGNNLIRRLEFDPDNADWVAWRNFRILYDIPAPTLGGWDVTDLDLGVRPWSPEDEEVVSEWDAGDAAPASAWDGSDPAPVSAFASADAPVTSAWGGSEAAPASAWDAGEAAPASLFVEVDLDLGVRPWFPEAEIEPVMASGVLVTAGGEVVTIGAERETEWNIAT